MVGAWSRCLSGPRQLGRSAAAPDVFHGAALCCRACLSPTCIYPHPLPTVPTSCLVCRPYTPAVPSPASQDAANN